MPPVTRSQTRKERLEKEQALSQIGTAPQNCQKESIENKEITIPKEFLKASGEKQTINDRLNKISVVSVQDPVKSAEQMTLSFHQSVELRIFARIHSDFSVQDWRQVIWNTTFRINGFKFWACMTYKGLGTIVQVDLEKKESWGVEDEKQRQRGLISIFTLGMDKTKKTPVEEREDRLKTYADLLKNDITQMIKKQKLKRAQCIFQFLEYIDYSNRSLKDWMYGSKQRFKSIIFGWPENSLDLHPMKPLVDILQAKLKTEYYTNAEGEAFIKRVVEQWNKIPLEEVKKSIDETAARLETVTKQKRI